MGHFHFHSCNQWQRTWIIDLKFQVKAFLAKLLVNGLFPRGEPYKDLIQHRPKQA
jgi:hypothetical protein